MIIGHTRPVIFRADKAYKICHAWHCPYTFVWSDVGRENNSIEYSFKRLPLNVPNICKYGS